MIAVLTSVSQDMPKKEVEESILATIREINEDFEKHARIGAVIISCEEWSIENEVLTPTLKIKRQKVEERFAELAEQLARRSAEERQLLLHWPHWPLLMYICTLYISQLCFREWLDILSVNYLSFRTWGTTYSKQFLQIQSISLMNMHLNILFRSHV